MQAYWTNEETLHHTWKESAVYAEKTEYTGTAADIIENGSLLVDCSDGVRRELHSGEISIRGIFGYSD